MAIYGLKGKIVALSISKKKGIPKTNVENVKLIEDWGIKGDVHAGKWHRQVSFLAIESIEKMRVKGLNVRPGAFAENITTEFVDIPNLHIGDIIKIEDAEFVITQIGKECHSKCAIYYKAGDCVMPREGIFARVTKGGKINVGNELSLIPPKYDITGVILAGGKNSRMGSDKAILDLDGEPFIKRIAGVLNSVFESTIIISDKVDDYKFLGLPIYPDIYKNCGPLGGIHTALSNVKTDLVFVVSCDLPMIKPEIIRQLLTFTNDSTNVIIPTYQDRIQPLCGIYSLNSISSLETYITSGGRKVLDFINSLKPVIVPFNSFSFTDRKNPFINVNTLEEYKTLISGVTVG